MTAPLTLPTISRRAPTQASFSLVANTQTFESPLNKSVQTYELPGARWAASWSYQNLTDADARILKTWLAKLRGQAGRFPCYDWTHPAPTGKAKRAGSVYGAGQSGRTINAQWTLLSLTIDNSYLTADMEDLTADAVHETFSDWLLPGDYIGVNGELKLVTDQVAMPSSGFVAIAFEPPFRSAPPAGAVITVIRPTCTMRLVDDKQDNMTFREQKRTDITISAVEVF